MEMNTEHEFAEPADPIPPDAPRRNSRRLVLLASFALTLVLAAGSFGFFLGHANQISTNAFANPGATNPRFPSGGYGSYGYYGGYPNAATTPAGNAPSSQANAAAA